MRGRKTELADHKLVGGSSSTRHLEGPCQTQVGQTPILPQRTSMKIRASPLSVGFSLKSTSLNPACHLCLRKLPPGLRALAGVVFLSDHELEGSTAPRSSLAFMQDCPGKSIVSPMNTKGWHSPPCRVNNESAATRIPQNDERLRGLGVWVQGDRGACDTFEALVRFFKRTT